MINTSIFIFHLIEYIEKFSAPAGTCPSGGGYVFSLQTPRVGEERRKETCLESCI